MSIYKMYANISATANSVATIDIQNDGYINAIAWSVKPLNMDALNDAIEMEVSFMSSATFAVNDARGSIDMCVMSQQFLTDGGGVAAINQRMSNLRIPVRAGERIHMHTIVDGGGSGAANLFLHVDDGVDDLPARKRR